MLLKNVNLEKITIRDLFPTTNGIFSHIFNSQSVLPDYLQFLQSTPLIFDVYFKTNWGMRSPASVVIYAMEESYDSELDDYPIPLTHDALTLLGMWIRDMYTPKWKKQAAVYNLLYDPIHNYSDEYHEALSEDIDKTNELTHNVTVANNETIETDTILTDGGSQVTSQLSTETSTRTDNLTQQAQSSGNKSSTRTDNFSEVLDSDTANNIYGYNSDEAVGDNTSATDSTRLNTGTQQNVGTSSDTTTTTNTGTQGKSQSGTVETTLTGGLTHTTDDSRVTSGTKRTTGTETDVTGSERTRTRDFTHLGNIGNHTTQQLITEEIELWRWQITQEILNDVKDFLTLPLYR